jgi:hypothetical protein
MRVPAHMVVASQFHIVEWVGFAIGDPIGQAHASDIAFDQRLAEQPQALEQCSMFKRAFAPVKVDAGHAGCNRASSG